MTSSTERYQLFIVLFTRLVGVDKVVTLLAGESMLVTGSF
jgi:hypothetical protein